MNEALEEDFQDRPSNEGEFRDEMERLGRASQRAQYIFLSFLPEVARAGYHRSWGYSSLSEYAAKVASIGSGQVTRVLALHRKIGRYRCLWRYLRNEGRWLTKLEVIAGEVRGHGDARYWAHRLHRSKRLLEHEVQARRAKRREAEGLPVPGFDADGIPVARSGLPADAQCPEEPSNPSNRGRLPLGARARTELDQLKALLEREGKTTLTQAEVLERAIEIAHASVVRDLLSRTLPDPEDMELDAQGRSTGEPADTDLVPVEMPVRLENPLIIPGARVLHPTRALLDRCFPYVLHVFRNADTDEFWLRTVDGASRLEANDMAQGVQLGEGRWLKEELSEAEGATRAASDGEQTKRALPRSTWRGVFARDGGLCIHCGALIEAIDHLDGFAATGEHRLERLEAVCDACHERRHADGNMELDRKATRKRMERGGAMHTREAGTSGERVGAHARGAPG